MLFDPPFSSQFFYHSRPSFSLFFIFLFILVHLCSPLSLQILSLSCLYLLVYLCSPSPRDYVPSLSLLFSSLFFLVPSSSIPFLYLSLIFLFLVLSSYSLCLLVLPCPSLSFLFPPCLSFTLFVPPFPSLPLLFPPCPSLSLLISPCPSLSLLVSPCSSLFPLFLLVTY